VLLFDCVTLQNTNYGGIIMSAQEKRSLLNLFFSILFTVVYVIIVYIKYNNGDFDTSNEMRLWSVIILIFIPISIAARIVATIMFSIINSIANEIKGKDDEDLDFYDERDKLIELKSTRVALVVFSLGFILALSTQAFGMSVAAFFLTMLGFGLLSEVIASIYIIIIYRKGA